LLDVRVDRLTIELPDGADEGLRHHALHDRLLELEEELLQLEERVPTEGVALQPGEVRGGQGERLGLLV